MPDAICESIESCRKSKGHHRDCTPKTFSTEDIDSDPSNLSEADVEIKFKPKQRKRANKKSATKMKDKKVRWQPKTNSGKMTKLKVKLEKMSWVYNLCDGLCFFYNSQYFHKLHLASLADVD
jgi:hypothetical protein